MSRGGGVAGGERGLSDSGLSVEEIQITQLPC